jgi:hypothetical protein
MSALPFFTNPDDSSNVTLAEGTETKLAEVGRVCYDDITGGVVSVPTVLLIATAQILAGSASTGITLRIRRGGISGKVVSSNPTFTLTPGAAQSFTVMEPDMKSEWIPQDEFDYMFTAVAAGGGAVCQRSVMFAFWGGSGHCVYPKQ